MGPLVLFSVAVLVALLVSGLVFYYIRTKNQERIKLIENGINPDEGIQISDIRKQSNLKNGILFLSFGVGLSLAHFMILNYDLDGSFIIYLAMLLIFGGIGFLINHILTTFRNTK